MTTSSTNHLDWVSPLLTNDYFAVVKPWTYDVQQQERLGRGEQFLCSSSKEEWFWAWPNRLAGQHSYSTSPGFAFLPNSDIKHSSNCLPFIDYTTSNKKKEQGILRGDETATSTTLSKLVKISYKIWVYS